jgi:hypothetical protein
MSSVLTQGDQTYDVDIYYISAVDRCMSNRNRKIRISNIYTICKIFAQWIYKCSPHPITNYRKIIQ